jgi:AcrR family transcriptional regulator
VAVAGGRSAAQPETPDGRVRRGERNREAILEAVFELVGLGDLRPTAEAVAQRAGVGTRTVFRHFADMERLHAEVSGRVDREFRPLLDSTPIEGGIVERALELVRRRVAIYERIAPFKRSANLHKQRSRFLQEASVQMVRRLREDLLRVLPELGDGPAPRVEALELVTSFEAWDRLRCDQNLGRDRACAALECAVEALLADRA